MSIKARIKLTAVSYLVMITALYIKSLSLAKDAGGSHVAIITVIYIVNAVCGYIISRSLRACIQKRIAESSRLLNKLESGNLDLSVNLSEETEFREIYKNIEQIVLKFEYVLSNLKSASKRIDQETNTMDNSILTHRETTKQATLKAISGINTIVDNVQSINASTEEIAKGAMYTAESLADISERYSRASGLVNEAGKKLDTVYSETNYLSKEVCITKDNVESLADKIEKINNFVAGIDRIASDVNMLALNATVEAARAGEAGRGFAVVASEIRKLSDNTSALTEQIKDLTVELDRETAITKKSVNMTGELALKNVEGIAESTRFLKDTETIFSDLDNSIAGIAAVTEEQAAQSQEVSALLETTTVIADTSANNVNELSSVLEKFFCSTSDLSKTTRKQVLDVIEKANYFH